MDGGEEKEGRTNESAPGCVPLDEKEEEKGISPSPAVDGSLRRKCRKRDEDGDIMMA